MKTHKQTPTRKGGQRFDWYPVLEEGFINSLTNTVLKKIHQSQSTRGRTKEQAERRTNDQQTITTHLLSGLYFAHTVISSESDTTYVSIPRDAGLYSMAQRKTNKIPYPYRPLATVYDCLEALGWIHIIPGKEGTGFTRVYAGGDLAEIFSMVGLRWVKQTPNSQDKLIVLRDRDMSLHGRFYGGWWQSINSKDWEYRTHITIDGHRTCEVDYSSVCLRIVYALRGISIDPEEDLYDIGIPGKYSRSKRDLVKEYINAIMNDEEETFSLNKAKLRQLGLTHEELQTLVLERHKPIREELIAGIGLKTQFIDSQIAENIMLTMVDKGVLVLPVHDSFIVKDKHQRLLETVMLESFKKYTGHPGSLDTTLPRLPCHFGYSKEHYKNLFGTLKVDSSLPLVNLGGPDNTQDNSTLMSSYMISWRDYFRNTSLSHLDHLY
jgi:hypothetical protein